MLNRVGTNELGSTIVEHMSHEQTQSSSHGFAQTIPEEDEKEENGDDTELNSKKAKGNNCENITHRCQPSIELYTWRINLKETEKHWTGIIQYFIYKKILVFHLADI